MELATIFLIWLAVTIIDNLAKRKKRRIPPENTPDFDIPTISNDPNLPGEEIPIFIEKPKQAEVRPIKKSSAQVQQKISKQDIEEETELNLEMTPSNVMNAFILGEILGKPKSLRRR
ncbi:MAG: hypothetical protein IKZ53_09285 [Selenomonadaceae bacterium]|nr:hypothetical protein [Selenomonadaceae bacterium]